VAALLALGVLILPLVEIYVLVLFAHAFGVLNTIALLVVCSVVGVWLARHEGFWVLARIRDSVATGRMPTNDLIDGGLVLVAGLLLIVPGFVTDGVGLLLLFPPTRAVARTLVRRRLRVRVYGYDLPDPAGRPPRRYDGPDDVIDV
jgi:UPF0716 protein FxsA